MAGIRTLAAAGPVAGQKPQTPHGALCGPAGIAGVSLRIGVARVGRGIAAFVSFDFGLDSTGMN